jgi:hypothetical protein
VDICSIQVAIRAKGAVHRNINIPVRCTLPASIILFTTTVLQHCRFLIDKDQWVEVL